MYIGKENIKYETQQGSLCFFSYQSIIIIRFFVLQKTTTGQKYKEKKLSISSCLQKSWYHVLCTVYVSEMYKWQML